MRRRFDTFNVGLRCLSAFAFILIGCSGSAVEGELAAQALTLELTSEQLELALGDTVQLQISVTANPSTQLYTVTYESSADAVATVSRAGLVTAVGEGTALVRVTATAIDSPATASASVVVAVGLAETNGDSAVQVVSSRTVTSAVVGLDSLTSIENLWDGDTSSDYQAKAGGEIASIWLELDLGEPFNLTRARLFGDADGTWITSAWTIRTKMSASAAWTTLFDRRACVGNGWCNEAFTGAGAAGARYLRVEIAGSTTATAVEARELEIWGDPVDGKWDSDPEPSTPVPEQPMTPSGPLTGSNRALGSFSVVDVNSYVNWSGTYTGSLAVPAPERTVATPLALPADGRGLEHSAKRRAAFARWWSSGKFLASNDVWSGSPELKSQYTNLVNQFVSQPVFTPNFAAANGATDAFNGNPGGHRLVAAAMLVWAGVNQESAVTAKLDATWNALLASSSADLYNLGANPNYMFSAAKIASHFINAYGFDRYRGSFWTSEKRAAMETWIARQFWYAAIAHHNHVKQTFPNEALGQFPQPSLAYGDEEYLKGDLDISTGNSPNGPKWACARYAGGGTTPEKIFHFPHMALKFGNQWGHHMLMMALGAAAVQKPSMIAYAEHALYTNLAFSKRGDGVLGEFYRNGDYGYSDQGFVYGATEVSAILTSAMAWRVSLNNDNMFAHSSALGYHGTEAAGPKSVKTIIAGMVDMRSGKRPYGFARGQLADGGWSMPDTEKFTYRVKKHWHEISFLPLQSIYGDVRVTDMVTASGDFSGKTRPGPDADTGPLRWAKDEAGPLFVMFEYQDLFSGSNVDG